MFDVTHPVFTTAKRAVEMLMGLGRDAYSPEVRARHPSRLWDSPWQGQTVVAELREGMCVGPGVTDGNNIHVTMVLASDGYTIEAYCEVSCGSRGVYLVKVYLYVDGEYVMRQVVSVNDKGELRL